MASVLQAVAAIALLAYMVLHFMRASRPLRRKLAFVYAAMIPFVLAFAVTSLLAGVNGDSEARIFCQAPERRPGS